MAIDKLKTKFVTGAFVNDVKHFFKKINEIIDWINNVGSTAVPNYKIYRALLTQTGTDAPVATVLENTLGNITYIYDSVGTYKITSTGLFTLDKVYIPQPNYNTSNRYINIFQNDVNEIELNSLDSSKSLSDNLLSGVTIEIIVYN